MGDPDLASHGGMCDAPAEGAEVTPPGPSARQPLSCARIVDAAVAYVDHDCLDSLSMRRLGAELGVEAMSLYRYFPSKAALLDAVVCRMLAEIALPADGADASAGAGWEAGVRGYARSFRAACAAHPRLLPLLATSGPGTTTLARIEERMTALWRAAGFDAVTAAHAQAALQGYLTGSCLQGIGTTAGDAAFGLGLDALIDGLGDRLRATSDLMPASVAGTAVAAAP
jgi:AcrR family transcriptional regulator